MTGSGADEHEEAERSRGPPRRLDVFGSLLSEDGFMAAAAAAFSKIAKDDIVMGNIVGGDQLSVKTSLINVWRNRFSNFVRDPCLPKVTFCVVAISCLAETSQFQLHRCLGILMRDVDYWLVL
jgi:hypothetical protein